jgi:hypothetical protein
MSKEAAAVLRWWTEATNLSGPRSMARMVSAVAVVGVVMV